MRLRELVQRHVDAIWRTARRLGVPAGDLEDIVQEVMLVVVRRLGDIDRERERAFVVGTAVRTVANWRRARRRRPEEALGTEDDALAPSTQWLEPEQAIEHRRKLALLEAALLQMTEPQRAAFVLFELEQMTASEIARELALPEAAVVSRVRRAREVFRRVVENAAERALAEPQSPDTFHG